MTTIVKVIANHGWPVLVTPISPTHGATFTAVRVEPGETRDFHAHSGQDLRIHEIQFDPAAAPAGDVAPLHAALPVSGYRPQSSDAVARVNAIKQMEERVLRLLDELKADPEIDQRWLQIGRTNLEQGFMGVVRSIFKPARAELVE